MSDSYHDTEPVLWKLIEGIIVNVLILIAVAVVAVMSVWEFLKAFVKGDR